MRFFKLRLVTTLSGIGIASLLNAYESLPTDKTKDYYLMNENSLKHYYFVETSQGKIAIWDTKPQSESQTPTVIFIHGHCTNKEFFSQQLTSPLFAKYRLIALDLPGYGKSNLPADPQKVYTFPGFADSVSEVINVMKLEDVIVIGWSLGGHVAIVLATSLEKRHHFVTSKY